MDQRSQFLVQVLEKLASPLVAAISEVSVRQIMASPDGQSLSPDQTLKNEAQQLASLLTSSTQLSISLSSLIDTGAMGGENADAVRVALAGIASPLVANSYRLAGRYPSEAEINRLAGAMGTVITYANNFDAAAEAKARLQNFDHDFAPLDADQQLLKYMFILLPVMNCILTYPFGMPEKKLLQDVVERLIRSVKTLRETLFPNMADIMAAQAELALLKTAALIYSQCHFAEMAKLMAAEDGDRQGMPPPMDALWQAYEQRFAMVQILAQTLVPNKGSAGSSSGAAAVTPAHQLKPVLYAQNKTPSEPLHAGLLHAGRQQASMGAPNKNTMETSGREAGGDSQNSQSPQGPQSPQKPESPQDQQDPMSFFAKKTN